MPAWRLSLLRPNYLPVTPELFSVMREKCPCYCPDPYLMVLAQTFEHKSYCDADLNRCLTILPIFFLFVRAEPRPAPPSTKRWKGSFPFLSLPMDYQVRRPQGGRHLLWIVPSAFAYHYPVNPLTTSWICCRWSQSARGLRTMRREAASVRSAAVPTRVHALQASIAI